MQAGRRPSRQGRERVPAGALAAAAMPAPRAWLVPALAAVVVVAGAWAYAGSLRGAFVLDDVRAIVRNPTIRTVWPLSVPLSPPSESTVAGRPFTNLSFAVSYALGPSTADAIDARSFHLGNLLVHLAAALALLGVVRRTLASPRLGARFGAAAPWLAAAVALLWAVHPLTTAAVTYVVQRAESLMSLLYLLTLYGAIRAHADPGSRRWPAAAVASCACGMATKEAMVTAPIAVALWLWLFGSGEGRRAGPVRWRLLAGLAATWLVLAALVSAERRGPSLDVSWGAAWSYLLTQAEVVAHYLRLAFVPTPLVFFYDWPLVASPAAVAWPATLLAALAAAAAVGIARRRPESFLGACFFLVLAPSSSVLPIVTEVAAEHRMYLPLAAVVAGTALAAFALGRRVPVPRAVGAIAAALAVAALAVALGAATEARNRTYRSAEGLWRDTVAKRPADARARVAYGEALERAGLLAEAEAELRTGVELAPGDAAARVRLGSVLARRQQPAAAIAHLEQALTLRPGDLDAHRLLAEIHAARREDGAAVRHYRGALARLPDDARLLVGLAAVLASSSDPAVREPQEARRLAERAALRTAMGDPRVLEVLAGAQAACGDLAQAARTARTAAGVARGVGEGALAAALEQRAAAYGAAVRAADRPAG